MAKSISEDEDKDCPSVSEESDASFEDLDDLRRSTEMSVREDAQCVRPDETETDLVRYDPKILEWLLRQLPKDHPLHLP